MCHVPFMSAGEMSGQFDIMPELYRAWNRSSGASSPDTFIGTSSTTRTQSSRIITPLSWASSRRDGIGATVIFGDGETEFRHRKGRQVTETFTLPRK